MLITISTITDHHLVLLYFIVLTDLFLMRLFSGDDPSVTEENFQLMPPFSARVLISTFFSWSQLAISVWFLQFLWWVFTLCVPSAGVPHFCRPSLDLDIFLGSFILISALHKQHSWWGQPAGCCNLFFTPCYVKLHRAGLVDVWKMLLTACSHGHWGFQLHRLPYPQWAKGLETRKCFAIGREGRRKWVQE